MSVRVVTDSSCDLPDETVAELGITIVPLTIRFGSEEFVDRVELSLDEFWDRLRGSKTLPETAAPSVGAFESEFRRLGAEGATGIVCVNLSSRLSATMQSAQLAAKALEGELPVVVVDSMSVSMGLGMQCVTAARLAAEGADIEVIAREVEDQADRTRLFGTLDTIEYLRKGGRVGAAQALLGEVLSIKPVVEVRDGVVAEAGKVRTRSKALRHLVERLTAATERGKIESVYVFDAQAPDVEEFLEMVTKVVPRDEILTGHIGPVIGTHAGPRTIGIGWVEPKTH